MYRAKAIRKDAVKMRWKQRYNLAISPRKAKKCKSRRWKEGLRGAKGKCMAKRIPAVIHVDETNSPHLHCDGAVDRAGESIGERRDRRKKMRRTQEKFLKHVKKGASR